MWYHRHKCTVSTVGLESHCLLWFYIVSCVQQCVQLPLISQHFVYYIYVCVCVYMTCTFTACLEMLPCQYTFVCHTHINCSHMNCIVCAPCMHLVSAGMGLQARLVLQTCIGVWSHGVCLQVCIILACSVSLFYHIIHVYCICIHDGVSWLRLVCKII